MAAEAEKTVTEEQAQVEKRPFQTEVQQLLKILIHSLYTDKEIFLRELISNASDALDKIRFRSLTDRNIVDPDAELKIDITVDKSAKTMTIRDTGIGMNREEANDNIGTIAHSGSANFLAKLAESEKEEDKLQLIGQFGVGFYSVFMVAERVVLTTRSADTDSEAVMWESTGDGSYTISTTRDRTDRGTEIKIYVRSDCEEFLDAHLIEGVIRRHSDYVSYPINVAGKQANQASALWTRSRGDITDEQYREFYTHLTADHEEPTAWEHIVVDVPIQFYAVLYIPKRSPMELLFSAEPKIAIHLHVKRVFIQGDCDELLPLYLRFVRGLVDCDDLPLNVARESLQNNPVMVKIRQTLVRRVLKMLETMAKNKPEDYALFWTSYGMVLKEGIARDFENKDEVSKLLRYTSSLSVEGVAAPSAAGDSEAASGEEEGGGSDSDAAADSDLISLQDYVDRMQSDQEVIYYLAGESKEAVVQSPLLEAFVKRNLEVLYMTDPVDEWVVNSLLDFDGKKFQAVDAEDLELKEDVKLEGVEADKERTVDLISFLKKELAGRVGDVKESQRLTDSPCVLVTPKGGVSQHMERLMKMADEKFESTKRVLEVNPHHPAIANIGALQRKERDSEGMKEWAHLLVDYALISEGTVEDPQRVVKTIQKLMTATSEQEIKS